MDDGEMVTVTAEEYYEQKAKVAKLEQETFEVSASLATTTAELASRDAVILSLRAELENFENTTAQANGVGDPGTPATPSRKTAVRDSDGDNSTASHTATSGETQGTPSTTVARLMEQLQAKDKAITDAKNILYGLPPGAMRDNMSDAAEQAIAVLSNVETQASVGGDASGAASSADAASIGVGGGASTLNTNTDVTFLDVPFAEKESAKDLGAQWEPSCSRWYVLPHVDLAPFGGWLPANRVYLRCPYGDKEAAKQLGAMWDKDEKKWFIAPSMEREPFARWLP